MGTEEAVPLAWSDHPAEPIIMPADSEGRRMSHELPVTGERSCPAAVAYDLMRDIMFEDPARPAASSAEFRAYLLDLYSECLCAVRGKRIAASLRPASSRKSRAAGGQGTVAAAN